MNPARRNALVLALLATVSLSGCGGEDGNQPAGAPQTSPADGTPIRIAFGDTELTARLDDNATARDLAAQLPLTLTFRDHNSVEKTAPLPRELSLEGAPEGHDPAAGDIGYWAPGGDLVFYYDSDAPFFNGIVRIGELHGERTRSSARARTSPSRSNGADYGVRVKPCTGAQPGPAAGPDPST
jgi:hypothetical protein